MKQLFSLFVATFFCIAAFAQPTQAPIAIVSPSGTTKLANTIQDAVNLADTNSIIYIPGGNFSGDINITKKLYLIGVGHYADSAAATGITKIQGDIYISGAGTTLEGFYLGGDIVPQTDNVVIYKVSFNAIHHIDNGLFVNNWQINNCILRRYQDNLYSDHGHYLYNFSLNNCIIESYRLVHTVNLSVNNCIFLSNHGNYFYTDAMGGNAQFNNCIFNAANGISNASDYSKIFNNCIFQGLNNNNGQYNNCHFSIASNNTFINQSGVTFEYGQNYKLVSNSVGKNAGTDGKDIGIYGGNVPYKDGAVPSNPQVKQRYVAPATGANGKLGINFTITNN